VDVLLLLLALLGHMVLWVAAGNRVHAAAMPRWMIRWLSVFCVACFVSVPGLMALWFLRTGMVFSGGLRWAEIPAPMVAYLAVCWIAAVAAVVRWVRRVPLHRPPRVLRWHRARLVKLAAEPPQPASQQHAHHFLVHLPGNEILKLDITERAIEVPRLAPSLDGLSIVHLSDFHLTGRVGQAYFQEVVAHSNQMEPDLVAITGDLVDRSPQIDWVPQTLGRLRARYGVYFILGNHDARVDSDRLRQVLRQSGLIDLGGRWVEIEVHGRPIVLAGNELPWFPPAADMRSCPPHSDNGPLRIVLSHSPDQLDWARARDVDLLLAGHTHGGQIRFPLLGAVLAPSRQGVKYAWGVFHAPPTIMHVTRGVSGKFPVRLRCPPEMAHLVLHAPEHP
jgi:predicted MPP superfamily phosphohydrolase